MALRTTSTVIGLIFIGLGACPSFSSAPCTVSPSSEPYRSRVARGGVPIHNVKQPATCRVGHQGRLRPVFNGAMGAHSRAVPTRRRMPQAEGPEPRHRVTRGHGAKTRLCPPYEFL